MASRLVDDEREIEAMRQRLQQCVTVSDWRDDELCRRLAEKAERELPGVEAFVIDDTGFPQKGVHSVGVARQYAGCLGRTDNCQIATSLHLGGEQGSVCIGMRLYLPETWVSDRVRRDAVGVSSDVQFERKWEIALQLLDRARGWGLSQWPVLADAGYGEITDFREQLDARGLAYVVGIPNHLVFWRAGTGPKPPARRLGKRGRPQVRYQPSGDHPVSASAIAVAMGREGCRTVSWREGSRGKQQSRFGRVRVRTAHRHTLGRAPGREQWLLWEWPATADTPTKYWLSTLDVSTSMNELVRYAKLRWRVERDYQEMKGELGLDHFEGRGWRGFHHHAALCAVAHGFLALHRALFPPKQSREIVDAGDGPAAASGRAAQMARQLSTVSAGALRVDPASRRLADVIE
jgi:SRSO17 transposase